MGEQGFTTSTCIPGPPDSMSSFFDELLKPEGRWSGVCSDSET